MTSARDVFFKLCDVRKTWVFLTSRRVFRELPTKPKAGKLFGSKWLPGILPRHAIGTSVCALGLIVLSATVPAEARRAYSSYGDIDEKTLENILNGKSPAKKTGRPKPKRRKPAATNATSSSSSALSSSSPSSSSPSSSGNAAAAKSSGSITTSAVNSQSANPNAASFAALAPVPTLQKGSLKGLSKKLSALVEMSPPTSLEMEREQALGVGAK